jgi:antitoxin VapB
MAFSIKNDEADLLLRELTALTHESLTEAVIVSVRDRLRREQRLRRALAVDPAADRLQAAIDRFLSLPIIDTRSEDEILGYDEHGLPS